MLNDISIIFLEIYQTTTTWLWLALEFEVCKALHIATGLSIVQILWSVVYQHSIKILTLFHAYIVFIEEGSVLIFEAEYQEATFLLSHKAIS